MTELERLRNMEQTIHHAPGQLARFNVRHMQLDIMKRHRELFTDEFNFQKAWWVGKQLDVWLSKMCRGQEARVPSYGLVHIDRWVSEVLRDNSLR